MRRVSTFSSGLSSAASGAEEAPATIRAASARAAATGARLAWARARGPCRDSDSLLGGIRLDGAQARLGAAPPFAQVGEHGEPGAEDQHAAADPDPGDQRIEVRLEGGLALLRIEPGHDEVE